MTRLLGLVALGCLLTGCFYYPPPPTPVYAYVPCAPVAPPSGPSAGVPPPPDAPPPAMPPPGAAPPALLPPGEPQCVAPIGAYGYPPYPYPYAYPAYPAY